MKMKGMRRFLALALSALLMLGSCTTAETVPALGEENAPAVQEAVVSAILEPEAEVLALAEEPAANAAQADGENSAPAMDGDAAASEDAATDATNASTDPAADAYGDVADGDVSDAADADASGDVVDADAPDGAMDAEAADNAADGGLIDAAEAIEIQEIRLPEKIELFAREDYQIVPQLLPEGAQGKLSYQMDNPNVATVDESGLLRGMLPGTSFVVVTAENGVSAGCWVRVVDNPMGEIPLEEIVLPEEIRIVEGRDQIAQVKLLPEGAYQELIYSIADPEIAKVGESGWIEAIRPGTTELTVTAYGGMTARTPVIVEQEGAEYYEITDGVLTKYKGIAHYIDLPEGITAIGEKAFADRSDLWEIHLPGSLQRIEYGAFAQCKNLRKVTMADGVTSIGAFCFEDCYALRSVRLSASLAEIGDSAFEGCSGLPAINLPSSLRSIGADAFYRCGALARIDLPDVTHIGNGAFSSTAIVEFTVPGSLGRITTSFLPNKVEFVKLEEGITAIEDWSFVYEQPLKRLELPYSLSYIADSFMDGHGRGATVYGPGGGYVEEHFARVKGKFIPYEDVLLTDEFRIERDILVEYTGQGGRVVIPDRVTRIGDSAFYGRSDVTEVVFPDGLTWIERRAFMNCTGLTELNLPSKLKYLEFYAFSGCTGLAHVEVPGSVTRFSGPFENCTGLESVVVNEGVEACGGFKGCVNLKQVKLPSTLQILGEDCFWGCTSLAQIEIPATVNNIGSRCFHGCTGLAEIKLPPNLQYLEFGAFEGCANLRSLKVTGKVSEIAMSTFKGCSSLTSVTLPEGLKTICGGSFVDCPSLKEVYVPASVREILYTEYPYIDGPVFQNCPQLTVYGKKGTAIQKYCADAGVPFKAVDADGSVISFPEGDLTLGVGQKYIPEIRVDSMAGSGNVTFSSSSSRVAVNKTTGVLTAKKTGTATITARTAGGAKASYKVTVKAAPKSIAFKEKNFTVSLEEMFRLEYILPSNTAASVTFEAESLNAIRHAPEEGVFFAMDEGVDRVTVRTHNGKSDTCTVTVVPWPTAVYVDRESITLHQTCTDVIVPSVNPESVCNRYEFISSDPEVVAVDENGRIEGLSQGTAEITVLVPTDRSLRATCKVTVIEPPPKVVLDGEQLNLGVNEKYRLNPRLEPAEDGVRFSYKSSNSKYVTVDEGGVITAKRTGSAAITVTDAYGTSAVCKVSVKRAPSSVKLSPAKGDLAVGDRMQFKWTLSSGAAGSVGLESSDPEILEIAEDGAATAKAPGTVKVRARTYNGRTATATIAVHPQPERVSFTREGDPMRFALGMKGTLGVMMYPSNFGSRSFESSDAGVISVDAATGAYVVRALGECDLTVTAYNGVRETRHAKVYGAPNHAKAMDAKLTLGVGERYRMRIDYSAPNNQECEPGFTYKSSSVKVATVDENGIITARKTGSATITATSFNGLKVSCKVTVKRAPSSLRLSATELTLGKDESFQLSAKLSPSGCGGVVRYETSDSNLAFVDAQGRIVANRDSGTVTITASLYNGLQQSCTVTLAPAPTSVEFDVDRLDLNAGMKIPVGVWVGGGMCNSLNAESTNERVAYLDDGGNVVAKKAGSAEITVETYNGCRASLYVTVAAAPSKYSLSLPSSVNVGYMYNLLDYFGSSPESNPYLSFDSARVSNKRAVIVENEMGVFLVPLEAGAFTLTVRSYNGKSVRKNLRAVEAEIPIEPEIFSPVRMDVQLQDYLGDWKLERACAEGVALPPEMVGLQGTGIHLAQEGSAFYLGNFSFGVETRMEGSALLLIDGEGEALRCTLHENGMLSMKMEGAALWFARR